MEHNFSLEQENLQMTDTASICQKLLQARQNAWSFLYQARWYTEDTEVYTWAPVTYQPLGSKATMPITCWDLSVPEEQAR